MEIHLPLQGDWLVFWGGDTKQDNQHHGNQFQNYAIDFVKPTDIDQTPSSLEACKSYGQEVISVADGTVVQLVDAFNDNPLQHWDEYNPNGNHIIVRHNESLYSVYSHLQPGIIAKKGETVTEGQVLGKVGNSGRTTQPHLHFALQSVAGFSRNISDDSMYGLRPSFSKIVVDGKQKKLHSPSKGQVVNNG